ncbi:MAG: hypothetical protein ACOYXY_14305 [Thermodesulfobacteriota bacterium]
MRFILASLLALIAAGPTFTPLPAFADMAPVRVFAGGGAVAPDHPHQTIRLDSQEVKIRLKSRIYEVDVVFDLFNTGESVTEWIGFPKWMPYGSHWPRALRMVEFKCSISGKQMEFNEEWDLFMPARLFRTMSPLEKMFAANRPFKRDWKWLVSQVTFPAHAKTVICVTYKALYHGRDPTACYVYGTGSLWKGNIGKAVFIVDSTQLGGTARISTDFHDGIGLRQLSRSPKAPPGPVANGLLEYELTDFEPHPEARFDVRLSRENFKFLPWAAPPSPPRPLPARIKNSVHK